MFLAREEFYIVDPPGREECDDPATWLKDDVPYWLFIVCALIRCQADPDLIIRIVLDVTSACLTVSDGLRGVSPDPVQLPASEYRDKLISAALKIASHEEYTCCRFPVVLLEAAERIRLQGGAEEAA